MDSSVHVSVGTRRTSLNFFDPSLICRLTAVALSLVAEQGIGWLSSGEMFEEFQCMLLEETRMPIFSQTTKRVPHFDRLSELVFVVKTFGDPNGVVANGDDFIVSEVEKNSQELFTHVHASKDQITQSVHSET